MIQEKNQGLGLVNISAVTATRGLHGSKEKRNQYTKRDASWPGLSPSLEYISLSCSLAAQFLSCVDVVLA